MLSARDFSQRRCWPVASPKASRSFQENTSGTQGGYADCSWNVLCNFLWVLKTTVTRKRARVVGGWQTERFYQGTFERSHGVLNPIISTQIFAQPPNPSNHDSVYSIRCIRLFPNLASMALKSRILPPLNKINPALWPFMLFATVLKVKCTSLTLKSERGIVKLG